MTNYCPDCLQYYWHLTTCPRVGKDGYAAKVGEEYDSAISPAHYQEVPGVECYDVIRHFPCTEANIIKYVWRHRSKGGVEDLRKAQWYLARLIEAEGEKSNA